MHFKAVRQHDGKRKLYQIIAGRNHGNVEQHQPEQRFALLGGGEGEVFHEDSLVLVLNNVSAGGLRTARLKKERIIKDFYA